MNALAAALAALPGPVDDWRPRRFAPADRELLDLVRSGLVRHRCDAILGQLDELMHTRAPDLSRPERDARLRETIAGRELHEIGVWVFYPWSGALAHVLDEPEFVELRSSRNRHRILVEEQALLRRKRIGIVGLSVGASSAVTMAMEGVGGRFRLADFDPLSLSNMNRIRASCADVGVGKAVLAARAMFEQDPFLDIEVFPEGLSSATLGAFLDGLDLVLDECDDLELKFAIRREARARRIPVLMETSDRGMLDIERFDLEPDRASFHGLVDEPTIGKALTTKQKVPLVLGILGATDLSCAPLQLADEGSDEPHTQRVGSTCLERRRQADPIVRHTEHDVPILCVKADGDSARAAGRKCVLEGVGDELVQNEAAGDRAIDR
jgi:molybdopterin/thiamine biosynthesis adenylyltransferase